MDDPKSGKKTSIGINRNPTFGQMISPAGDTSKNSSQRVRKTPISDNKGDGIFITKHKLTVENLDRAFPPSDTKKSDVRVDNDADYNFSEASVS